MAETHRFDYVEFKKFALSEGPNWTTRRNSKGILVQSTEEPDSPIVISRACGIIHASMDVVHEAVIDPDSRPRWDPMTAKTKLVRRISDSPLRWVMYLQSRSFWPVCSPRDFLMVQEAAPVLEDGSRVYMGSHYVGADAELPQAKGHVRGLIQKSGFVLQPISPNETRVTYLVQLNLAGYIPTVIANLILSDAPWSLVNFRKLITGSEEEHPKPN